MTSSAPPPDVRSRIGKYVIQRRIAVGGMSEVYEARLADNARAAPVVLKVLLPQHVESEEFARMFAHEGRINAALSHPNLVEVHELGEADGRSYLAMELVEGLRLSDLCGSPMEVGLALHIVRELLEALAYVHEALGPDGKPLAIVHRDVTPHNVLLSVRGAVKLGDFGIARSSLRDTRTTTGVMKGKLRYMSPEQATVSSVDTRSDLYSVGLILYELVTGEPFIRGATEIEVLRAAEAPPFRAPSEHVPVDRRIDALVRHAVARFPEERYQSARAFLADVDELRTALGVVSSGKELAARVTETQKRLGIPPPQAVTDIVAAQEIAAPPSRRSNTKLLTLGAASALVVGSAFAVTWFDDTPPPKQRAPRENALGSSTPLPVANDAGRLAAAPDVLVQSGMAATTHDARPMPLVIEATTARTRPRGRAKQSETSTVDSVPDAGMQSVANSSVSQVDEARRAELSARFERLRTSMQSRGILSQDLDVSQQRALRGLVSDLVEGQLDGAEAALNEIEVAVREIRIDGPFVRRKLERMNRLVQSADPARVRTEELDAVSGAALQEYLGGRFEATNARLNHLWQLLSRTSQP